AAKRAGVRAGAVVIDDARYHSGRADGFDVMQPQVAVGSLRADHFAKRIVAGVGEGRGRGLRLQLRGGNLGRHRASETLPLDVHLAGELRREIRVNRVAGGDVIGRL